MITILLLICVAMISLLTLNLYAKWRRDQAIVRLETALSQARAVSQATAVLRVALRDMRASPHWADVSESVKNTAARKSRLNN